MEGNGWKNTSHHPKSPLAVPISKSVLLVAPEPVLSYPAKGPDFHYIEWKIDNATDCQAFTQNDKNDRSPFYKSFYLRCGLAEDSCRTSREIDLSQSIMLSPDSNRAFSVLIKPVLPTFTCLAQSSALEPLWPACPSVCVFSGHVNTM